MRNWVKRTQVWGLLVAASVVFWVVPAPAIAEEPKPAYGYSVFGNLKYPPDFAYYDYANPDAPKGGDLRMGINGSFDSLNDLVVKGTAAYGLDRIYDQLMNFSADEIGGAYALIAESITVAPDYSWVSFDINPKARWHDGKPITVEDVIFSYEILRDESAPIWKGFLADVKGAEVIGPRSVRFDFVSAGRHKQAFLMGGLRIYPKHYWQGRDFSDSTMDPPLGGSAYRIKSVDQGRSIVYERVKDYWARDLPVKKGLQNFDTITYEYFRDENSRFEAFKSGLLNHRVEGDAPKWARSYNFAAVKSGDIVKTIIQTDKPVWMLAYAPNMRLEKFKDRRVREAFDLAFDFDWLNKNFLYGLYARTDSYFDNSHIGASGIPSGKEAELLEPYRGNLPDELFVLPFEANHTDGSGNNRAGLRKAMALLKEAGWENKDGALTHTGTGEVFAFELLVNNALMVRVASPWIAALKKLGIQATTRQVDSAQYFNRISDFDYDMIVSYLPQGAMPTRELKDFWGSGAAKRKGSLNFPGIEDEAIDDLLEVAADSNDPETFFAALGAIDRILLWNHYMIPMYHTPESWRAHVKELKRLEPVGHMYDSGFPYSWWYEDNDLAALK